MEQPWQAWGMSHLIDTTEMFLKAIFELNEQGRPATRAKIADRLEQSAPSVSQTVARMERDGLLTLEADRTITFSAIGIALATSVMRKHRLAERLLLDVLEFPWPDCHEEACHWEHVISSAAEAAIRAKLARTDRDPYGNPIPGEPAADDFTARTPIDALPVGSSGSFILMTIGEQAQAREGFLHDFWNAGMRIDDRIKIETTTGGFALTALKTGASIDIDRVLAHDLYVRPFVEH